MKRPLAGLALLYVAGVATGRFLAVPLLPLFILTFAAALLAIWGAPRTRPRFWIFLLLFLCGWTNLLWRFAILSPYDLRTKPGEEARIARVQGRLIETPYIRPAPPQQPERLRTIGLLEVERVRFADQWEPASGLVITATEGALPPTFCRGRQVELTGVLKVPARAVAEGLFDYRNYLRWKRIHHQFEVLGSDDWKLLPPVGPFPLTERFVRWAQATLAKGLPAEDLSLRLLWAMALGWKTGLTDEVSEPFMQTGTMHIFAISGLHIALIAGILISLLRVAQVPRAWAGWVVIPLIWGYTAATGWQPSAIRSTIMMSVVIAGWSLKRPGDLLNSLAASAFIILLWQPEQLFQVSFQLSFFVVLALALIGPHTSRLIERLFQPDPFLPSSLQPRWRQWFERPGRFLLASVSTSLAAWIGSLLLVAYYFHLLTPVGLLANLVIVPLSSLALMSNLGSLVAGGWFPALTVLFNHSAWFWMQAMVQISVWAAHLPAAYCYVRGPTALEFAIYYGLLLVLTGKELLAPRWRATLSVAVAGCGCVWLGAQVLHRHDAKITVLPGGGDAIVFRRRGGSTGLIDGGNQHSVETLTVPFLHGQGVNRLDWLALTHGDINHVGGFPTLRDVFNPRHVFTSHAQFRSPAYRQALKDLASHPDIWRKVSSGESLGSWNVLYPGKTPPARAADEQALVLQARIHDCTVLLLSDLGPEGQKDLLEQAGALRSDLVATGLPGRGEPLTEPLLDAISPQLIIVNSSDFPPPARASPRLRSRLLARGTPVIFTSDSGAATIHLGPRACRVETMKGERYAIRRRD